MCVQHPNLLGSRSSHRVMRGQWARICILAVCWIACCLACSEVPETLSLSDDASNDFVFVSAAHGAVQLAAEQKDAESHQAEYPASAHIRTSGIDKDLQRARPGADLLSLISLLRI